MSDSPAYPGTPRWVKISVATALLLALLFVVLKLSGHAGRHGPGRHFGNVVIDVDSATA